MNHVEFLFGTTSGEAEAFCKRMQWKPYGRGAWRKPNGTVVCFTCFIEQLAAVEAGMTVHVLGQHAPALRALRKIGAVIVQL